MKNPLFLILIFCAVLGTGYSQEKSKKDLKKEQKEKEKIEKEKQTSALIESKAFVFVTNRALPSGARSIDLTGDNYFVKFENDLIESFLPYFGRAFSGAGYGGDNGIKFKEAPISYDIKKAKKNYEIEVVVKKNNETYNLSLTVGFQGSASLFVNTNNRSPITFQGKLEPIEKEVKNE